MLEIRKYSMEFESPNDHHGVNGEPPKVLSWMKNGENFRKISSLSLYTVGNFAQTLAKRALAVLIMGKT